MANCGVPRTGFWTDSASTLDNFYLEMKIAEIKDLEPNLHLPRSIPSYKPVGWHKILRTLEKNHTNQILKSYHSHKIPIKNKSKFFPRYNV